MSECKIYTDHLSVLHLVINACVSLFVRVLAILGVQINYNSENFYFYMFYLSTNVFRTMTLQYVTSNYITLFKQRQVFVWKSSNKFVTFLSVWNNDHCEIIQRHNVQDTRLICTGLRLTAA